MCAGVTEACTAVVCSEGGHAILRDERQGGDQRGASISDGGAQRTHAGDRRRNVQRVSRPNTTRQWTEPAATEWLRLLEHPTDFDSAIRVHYARINTDYHHQFFIQSNLN